MKYKDSIHAKKSIMKQKLTSIAKELALLKLKAEADMLAMMTTIMKIKKTKTKTIGKEYVEKNKENILCMNLHNLSLINKN